MTTTDLTNCDHEPIHIPGKVQGHGFLIAVDQKLTISYCSENIATFVPTTAIALLGTPIYYFETVILNKVSGFINKLIKIAQNKSGFYPVNPYLINVNDRDFNLIICAAADHFTLEFEPAISDLQLDLQQHVGSSLSEILSNATLELLLDRTASRIRELIGYDRVMVYKFHDDGHGEVMAEAKNEELAPWLGLHYPASDIPRQARELYKLNLVRLIADVEGVPSDIVTYAELNETPLDLTYSSLRAVSPIHIQYLKNMGVSSSFSVSLIHQGELWGLVACHNYTPRFLDYKQREAAKLIGQVLSSALSFRQQEEDQHKNSRLKDAVDDLTRHLLRYNNIEDALFKHETTILDAVEADGAVLGEYLIWFRPEMATKVHWAGNPAKPVEYDQSGLGSISPRTSFKTWTQQVQLTCAPWQNEDFRSALQLKEEVSFAISRKATQLRIMNENLKDAYDELDAFSYTISHDLKNPLTAIKSYSQLLKRQLKLEPREERMLDGILTGANRMQAMIEEVLNYSRAGQLKAVPRFVDMAVLLAELKEQLLMSNENIELIIEIGHTPAIYGDKTMIQQVFANLLGNAVKYSGKIAIPRVIVSGEQTGSQVRYQIKDNGIGVKLYDRDKIFDLFSRSDNVDDFEGTGVGLAIVKKIMEKHNGRVWVESEPGAGSTFHVTFKMELEIA